MYYFNYTLLEHDKTRGIEIAMGVIPMAIINVKKGLSVSVICLTS